MEKYCEFFDKSLVLDSQKAITYYESRRAYHSMLEEYSSLETINQYLFNLAHYYQTDSEKFQIEVYFIQDYVGCFGAGKVYDITLKISQAYRNHNYEEEYGYYSQLLKQIILLTAAAKKEISSSKEHALATEDCQIVMANGFKANVVGDDVEIVKDDTRIHNFSNAAPSRCKGCTIY